MESENDIPKLSLLVLMQVILFFLIYLATIATGIALMYVTFHASALIIPYFFENVAPKILQLGRLGIFPLICIIIATVGLWAFILAVGIYLIKPLFIFPKRSNNHGKEITREDSPELFDMIMETANEAGVKKPKHIYVNHEVNACVFFNTGFWNMFFPVRKNIAIGLGLFESTNKKEVKSIIAHEFGHFAQSSMHVGSVLYITNKIITDLVYRRDKLDNIMLRWCLKDGIWGFWGKSTQIVVIEFRKLADYMFRKQQRNYMKLSRQMEYDADTVACKLVGSETFISSLCKIRQNATSFDFYNRVLVNFSNEGIIVSDYWKGYSLAIPSMRAIGIYVSSHDKLESNPKLEETQSRVAIEEVWESHPTIQKRINHALSILKTENKNANQTPAWLLISDKLKDEVSFELLSQIKRNNTDIKTIDWDFYQDTLNQKIEISIFPHEIEVFFNRDILFSEGDYSLESPLNDDNKKIIIEYEQARRDMVILDALNNDKISVSHFLYNDIDYSINNVPIETHQKYLAELENSAKIIDRAIKATAISKSQSPDLIEAAYIAILYTQSITSHISNNFIPIKEDIIRELNKAAITDIEDYERLKTWLGSYETALKDILKSLNFEQMVPFMSREEHEHIIRFIDDFSSFARGINSNAIDHMFAVTDWILRIHNSLNNKAKMVIVNTLLDKSLPDTDFLKLWIYQPTIENAQESQEIDNDGKEHIVINSEYGKLSLIIPTDEEIDTIYYQEWFRYRMCEKFDSLEEKQEFDYALIATIPFKDVDGHLSCINQDDEEKFNVEIQEYNRFLELYLQEDDWEAISDSANRGSAYAYSRLASLYLSQNRIMLAYEHAMKAALAGDPDGISILGIIKNEGKNNDHALAVKLFKCAAVGGNMRALCNLGLQYLKGVGIEQDELRAAKLFERASLQGHTSSQYHLGCIFLNEKSANTDPEHGLYWLYKAANKRYEPAINKIWQYHKSVGNTKEYTDVVRIGAQMGIEECQAELDNIYT